jgi:hypothetical protein
MSGKELGNLSVAWAKTPAPDDFLYAPIDDAYLSHDPATGVSVLHLNGTFTTRCSRIKQVLINYYEDTIVVQPEMEQYGEDKAVMSEKCGAQITRFEQTVDLKSGLKGTYLLHVRALHGQAVNKLVTIP